MRRIYGMYKACLKRTFSSWTSEDDAKTPGKQNGRTTLRHPAAFRVVSIKCRDFYLTLTSTLIIPVPSPLNVSSALPIT